MVTQDCSETPYLLAKATALKGYDLAKKDSRQKDYERCHCSQLLNCSDFNN